MAGRVKQVWRLPRFERPVEPCERDPLEATQIDEDINQGILLVMARRLRSLGSSMPISVA
ncbi:MAG: hypothetical protein HS114_19290 [Anaerolineales bacterium]|nr:hypothetical protein [Anaerolineales bacterium]